MALALSWARQEKGALFPFLLLLLSLTCPLFGTMAAQWNETPPMPEKEGEEEIEPDIRTGIE